MPDIHTALRSFLLADDDIAFAVGDTRVYSVRLPEGAAYPAIALQKISTDRTLVHDPEPHQGWTRSRFQITCWSNSMSEAFDLGDAVLAALSGFNGDMEGVLLATHPVNEFEDYDGDFKVYRRIMDFLIAYDGDQETVSS